MSIGYMQSTVPNVSHIRDSLILILLSKTTKAKQSKKVAIFQVFGSLQKHQSQVCLLFSHGILLCTSFCRFSHFKEHQSCGIKCCLQFFSMISSQPITSSTTLILNEVHFEVLESRIKHMNVWRTQFNNNNTQPYHTGNILVLSGRCNKIP